MNFKHRRSTVTRQSNQSGGLGFVSVLTLIFITLKLTDTIAWSWFWVLSPMWISALIAISAFGFIAYKMSNLK